MDLHVFNAFDPRPVACGVEKACVRVHYRVNMLTDQWHEVSGRTVLHRTSRVSWTVNSAVGVAVCVEGNSVQNRHRLFAHTFGSLVEFAIQERTKCMFSSIKNHQNNNNNNIIIIIIMYIYRALINVLSARIVHRKLNMIFYTHVQSYQKQFTCSIIRVKSKETVGNSWTVLKVILGHKYHNH